MTNSEEKAILRAELLAHPTPTGEVGWGRAAEQVRRLDGYRQAKQIYVGPAPSLLQVRINALLDGKELIMPAPGLREGFYLIKPFVVPFKELAVAVTFRGQAKYGQRLRRAELAALRLDLLLTDALAVDSAGGRLGKGTGYFDLACAIFAEYKILALDCGVYGVIAPHQFQTELLPQEPWDVPLTGWVTREESRILTASATIPPIIWESVAPRRVRKLQPLWEIHAALKFDPPAG